jgi:hypothetical protein
VTIVVVVSFMVEFPSRWFVAVRFDRTAAPISSVAAELVRPIYSGPPGACMTPLSERNVFTVNRIVRPLYARNRTLTLAAWISPAMNFF